MKRRCPVCHKMRPSYLFDSHVTQCRTVKGGRSSAHREHLTEEARDALRRLVAEEEKAREAGRPAVKTGEEATE